MDALLADSARGAFGQRRQQASMSPRMLVSRASSAPLESAHAWVHNLLVSLRRRTAPGREARSEARGEL
jgi:hypothetical protein